jgi:hypothetical protein
MPGLKLVKAAGAVNPLKPFIFLFISMRSMGRSLLRKRHVHLN